MGRCTRPAEFFGSWLVQFGVGSEKVHVFATRDSSTRPARLKRPAMFAVAVLASVATVTGCGSSHHSATSVGAADTIVIKNFAFNPSSLTVAPGATVTVRNADPATHTVTASGASKPFDTGDIPAGKTVTFTAPTKPGTYPYICQIHQFMHGTLQVR